MGKLSVGGVMRQLVPAATGAVGAIGLDIAMGYVPIPAQYKTGWLGTGVKVVGAVALGMIAGKVVGREKGRLFTAGALTVIAYQAIRTALATAAPTIPGLSGLGGMGAYMVPTMPALAAPKKMAGLGAYMNPSPILNGLDGGYSADPTYNSQDYYSY